jgi:hypothetical protein
MFVWQIITSFRKERADSWRIVNAEVGNSGPECWSVSDKCRLVGAIRNVPIRRESTGRERASPSGGTKKTPAPAGHRRRAGLGLSATFRQKGPFALAIKQRRFKWQKALGQFPSAWVDLQWPTLRFWLGLSWRLCFAWRHSWHASR